MKHVYIYGWCHHSDLDYLDEAGKNDLKFYSGPTPNAYTVGSTEWYNALGAASNADLAIFCGFGTNMFNHIAPIFRDTTAKQIFEAIPIKVFWSFDTHWQWQSEARYSHYFDHFYTAHQVYAPLVPGAKYLPVGFYPASWAELKTLEPLEPPKFTPDPLNPGQEPEELPDVVFPSYEHTYGDREALKELAAIRLRDLGISYCFATAPDRLEYLRKIMAAKVCLNIPSLGNLNFRNFEAWAVGTPLLAPRSSNFNQFPELKQRSFLFNRDFSDFDETVARARTAGPTGTVPLVLADNMMLHRYLEIINHAFGTSYKIQYPV